MEKKTTEDPTQSEDWEVAVDALVGQLEEPPVAATEDLIELEMELEDSAGDSDPTAPGAEEESVLVTLPPLVSGWDETTEVDLEVVEDGGATVAEPELGEVELGMVESGAAPDESKSAGDPAGAATEDFYAELEIEGEEPSWIEFTPPIDEADPPLPPSPMRTVAPVRFTVASEFKLESPVVGSPLPHMGPEWAAQIEQQRTRAQGEERAALEVLGSEWTLVEAERGEGWFERAIAGCEAEESRFVAALEETAASAAEARGDFAAAHDHFATALRSDRSNRTLTWGLFRTALRRGIAKPGELAPLIPPGEALSRRFAARLRLATGDAATAADLLSDAGDYLEVVMRARAEAALARPHLGATLEQLAEAAPHLELRGEALVQLAQWREAAGQPQEARRLFEKVAATLGDAASRVAFDCERLERLGEEGTREVERLRAQATSDPAAALPVRVAAARRLRKMGRSEEAADELEVVLAAEPCSWAVLCERIEVALDGNRLAEAAVVLARAARAFDLTGDSASTAALSGRAVQLYRRAHEERAACDEVAWLIERPLPPHTRLRLLARFAEHGELTGKWIAVLRELAESQPGDPEGWYRLARALSSSDAAAASLAYARALAIDPLHPGALFGLSLAEQCPPEMLRSAYEARLQNTADRPEAAVAARRLAAHPAAGGERALSAAEVAELVARLSAERDPIERLVAGVQLGDRLMALAQPAEAARCYGEARAAHSTSPLVFSALLGAVRQAGNWHQLRELGLEQLRAAGAPAERIAAYQLIGEAERFLSPASPLAYESILELAPNHPPTLRCQERSYLERGELGELGAIYEQLGRQAEDPEYGAELLLEAARLLEPRAEALLRSAADRAPSHRWASERALELGREDGAAAARRFEQFATRVRERPLEAAIGWMRAAELRSQNGEARDPLFELVRRATEAAPGYLTAARWQFEQGRRDHRLAEAEAGALTLAEQLHDLSARAEAWRWVGELAEARGAPDRAVAAFRAALELEPAHDATYQAVRRLLVRADDPALQAAVIEARLSVEREPTQRVGLLVELAENLRSRDRSQAKHWIREALRIAPDSAGPLELLAELHGADEEWVEAAALLEQRAQRETALPKLRDLLLRLSAIYARGLSDRTRAIATLRRVLVVDPEQRDAMAPLADLEEREENWRGALELHARLVELDPASPAQVARLQRIAWIQEMKLGDLASAHQGLRRSVEMNSGDLVLRANALEELGRFYERRGDGVSAQLQLGRATEVLRQLALQSGPEQATAYHGLFRIHNARKAFDEALVVAELLWAMGIANAEEQALLSRSAGTRSRPQAGFLSEALEPQLFPRLVSPGVRQLFLQLDPLLRRAHRLDPRRSGLLKEERQAAHHPLRRLADALAPCCGTREFELYVTRAQPMGWRVVLTDPVALVFGRELVEGVSEEEQLFQLAGALRLLGAQMAVPLHLSGEELAQLVAGMVRLYVPDFVPLGFAEEAVSAEAARLGKLLSRKQREQLGPFALECADPVADLRSLGRALRQSAARAGLIACGSIAAAMAALGRSGEGSDDLVRFALSEGFAIARRMAVSPGR